MQTAVVRKNTRTRLAPKRPKKRSIVEKKPILGVIATRPNFKKVHVSLRSLNARLKRYSPELSSFNSPNSASLVALFIRDLPMNMTYKSF